jgi:hypothetical protein
MPRLTLGLVALLALTLAAAPAGAAPSANDAEALNKWIKTRVKSAKEGKREIVRAPLVDHSDGWGCTCPQYYLGTVPDMAASEEAWVKPVAGPGLTIPAHKRSGWVMVVEGYFTGQSGTEAGDAGVVYTVYELQLIRIRPMKGDAFDDDNPDAQLQILLSGEEAAKEPAPLSDARPWLVLVASYPLSAKDTEKKAQAQKDKLSAAGFTAAEILDSRQAQRLYCCYAIVAAGRYETEAEARAALKEVKKKFKGAYVKQGW